MKALPFDTYTNWETAVDADFPANMLEDIERFLTKVHPTLEPGKDFYPEVFATQLFFPLQRQAELAAMMRIARAVEPKVVMEIGADKGGGLYHWCQCLLTVEVLIACEIRGCPYQQLFTRAFPDKKMFAWLERSSRPPPNLVAQSIDVLFIDGDKGAFYEDFEAYLPLMDPKGVVFFHDINEPGSLMRKAWVKASKGRRSREIVDLSDTYAALVRMDGGLPPANPHEAWLRHWRGRSCGVGVVWLGGA